jgi:hypothetical protein
LSVCATVGNGVDTGNIPVVSSAAPGSTYYPRGQTTEMHLYSDQPLIKKIKWTILQGANLVAEFIESPRVARIADGLQYARLIGSSSYLVPLAAHMPTSIASTIGFVDKKYSLLALEEDSLPASVAQYYENHGVPELTAGDIFASADEHFEPVAQWLTDHPPRQMSQAINGFWGDFIPVKVIAFEDMAAVQGNVAQVAGNQPVRMAPFLQSIYATSSNTYPDYSDALAVKPEAPHASASGIDVVTVKNGFLVINTGRLKMDNGKPVVISLFDFSGRIIGQWNVSATQSRMIPLCTKLAHGAYIARITCGSIMTVQPIAIK